MIFAYFCHTMRWGWLALVGGLWAQSPLLVLAKLEGGAAREGVIRFIQGKQVVTLPLLLRGGEAYVSWPSGWRGPAVVELAVPGYLPIRLAKPVTFGAKQLDFTQPQNLDPASGFVLIEGQAYLAAGDLGALPEERYPTINAYDLELFLTAHQNQDRRADFNGDGVVDEKDLAFLVKNQNVLLQSRL